ncbi:MAG: Fur family transcriptional regulator [Bacteroidia bacterium]|nr:Fur family transcriptional regulator [Bacteroidia bacterium]
MNTVRERLKSQGLRSTPCREALLSFFYRHGGTAFSFAEVEKKFSDFDRATVFRTLKTLLESGLVHKTNDDEGVRYALTRLPEIHAHFKCTECGTTLCMDSVVVRPPTLPEGFLAKNYDFVVTGACRQCTALKA